MQGDTAKMPGREVDKALLNVNEEERHKEKAADLVHKMAEEKKKQTLAYKRSFFVRMVSDPKIYNPKIVKIKSADGRGTLESISDATVQPDPKSPPM